MQVRRRLSCGPVQRLEVQSAAQPLSCKGNVQQQITPAMFSAAAAAEGDALAVVSVTAQDNGHQNPTVTIQVTPQGKSPGKPPRRPQVGTKPRACPVAPSSPLPRCCHLHLQQSCKLVLLMNCYSNAMCPQ